MEYVWSCAPAYIITDLFKKQKTAVRIITNSKYNAHTEPLSNTWTYYLSLP